METVPGMMSDIPGSMFAVGGVDEKGVAAAIGVFFVAHADPIWVRPDLRRNGIARELWAAAKKEIAFRRYGPEVLFAIVPGIPDDETAARLIAGVSAAGGQELEARFFTVPVLEESDTPL